VFAERTIWMRVLAYGFWGVTHWVLDTIGRATGYILPGKTSQREDEARAMTGGAVLGAIFGAAFGFILSDESRDINTIAGASLGMVLGACSGIIYGAVVHVMDDSINALINSWNSK
jgi:outer membrane lipoprotein SlyB